MAVKHNIVVFDGHSN